MIDAMCGHRIGAVVNDPCHLYQYKLHNVGGANAARVVGQADGTHVWLHRSGNSSLLTTLAENDVHEFATQQGDILCSNLPIWANGEEGAADIVFQPDWSASNEVGGTMSRGGGVDISLFSLGATSADIYRNGALITTLALTPNQASTFTQSGAYTGNWHAAANGQVLGFKRQRNQGNSDSSPMAEPSTEIVGYFSTDGRMSSSNTGGVTFTSYPMAGNNYTGTIATTYNILTTADFGTPGGGAADNYYDPRVAIRTQSADLLYANSRADSDGSNDTAHFPTNWMRTHHRIPQPTEFVSILSLTGATVDVFDENGAAVTTLTPTKTNADPLAPFAVRFGTPNGSSNHPAGYSYVSSDPIYVVYQSKGAGVFGSDDDESVSYGWNL